MSQPSRNPVLLIHGIDDTIVLFDRLAAFLNQRGWKTYSLNLTPNNGDIGLDELAQQVAHFVAKTFAPEQAIDLVGFSMGGIISRYYVQRLGGIDRVQRFITIASPHHGTITAYARMNPGCLQMRRNSLFLDTLNRDVAMLEQINFTSIWSPLDLMIFPANSSRMPVGKEIVIPVAAHAWMVNDRRVQNVVAEVLSEPIRNGVEQFPHQRDRQFEQNSIHQKLPQGSDRT